jgi:hypothetical protein
LPPGGDPPIPSDHQENFYAWDWGDALFVVLDPYTYTAAKPHDLPLDGGPGTGDNWDWTLGYQQYAWLINTLEQSQATFKFVFIHQLTAGMTTYGRGGVEAASHALGGMGSFEWGGESLSGVSEFDIWRHGWGRPIHQLLVDNNVGIVFKGHDHVFVKQELDGMIYQTCPQTTDTNYGQGHYAAGGYQSGDMVNNAGYLRVTVSPTQADVEYVRVYLSGDGQAGEVAYTYTVPAPPSP